MFLDNLLSSCQIGSSFFGRNETEQDVHLFKRQSLGLGEEEGKDSREDVDSCEEEELASQQSCS